MGYPVVNFEIASSSSFRDIKRNQLYDHVINYIFVTAAKAGIDDSIQRKHIRVSLNNVKVNGDDGKFQYSSREDGGGPPSKCTGF